MRVLHVSWEYPPDVQGGLGRHVHALAEATAAAGHEVVVLTGTGIKPSSASLLDASILSSDTMHNGVRVVRASPLPPVLPFDVEHLLAWALGFNHALLLRGLELMATWRPDVIHAHDWLVAQTAVELQAALVVGQAPVPLVTTMHATEAGRHQGWLPGPLNRSIHEIEWWLTQRSDEVVVCSEHMRSEINRLFEPDPALVHVIANGVHVNAWHCTPAEMIEAKQKWQPTEGAPLLVHSGRLEWEKGSHTLVAAMPRLRRQFPGIKLIIAGRGSQSGALAEQCKRLRLGRSVELSGWVPEGELAALLGCADAVVLPSLYEPFGIVALEAAASGAPLVVARTGGLAEFVRDGINGMTFSPGDPMALADAVAEVLNDRSSARARAERALETLAAHHTWDGVARDVVAVYQQATPRTDRQQPSNTPDHLLTALSAGRNLLRN